MKRDEWKLDLDNKADTLNLMLRLTDTGTAVKLSRPYMDALMEHAKSMLTQNINLPDAVVSQWSKVLNVLGKTDVRKTFRREILDMAMNQNGKFNDGFFKLYGAEINNPVILSEEKMVVYKLFRPLVRERSVGGLRWLNDVFANNRNILEKYTDTASVQDFRERIQDEIGKPADDDDAHKLIAGIANVLGIKPEEAPQQDDTLSDSKNPEDDSSEGQKSKEE